MPVGVHLAVVDPDVGGTRRAVAIRTTDGRHFVGPDNGLLLLAADELGIEAAHELTDRAVPAARALPDVPRPRPLRTCGRPPRCRCRDRRARARDRSRRRSCASSLPEPEVGRTQVSATVLVVDRFGNVATNARREHVDALGVADGDRVEIRLTLDRYYAIVARTFADAQPGELILYEDSYGLVDARDQPRRRRAADGRRRAATRSGSPGRDDRAVVRAGRDDDRRTRACVVARLPPAADEELRPPRARVGRDARARDLARRDAGGARRRRPSAAHGPRPRHRQRRRRAARGRAVARRVGRRRRRLSRDGRRGAAARDDGEPTLRGRRRLPAALRRRRPSTSSR